MPYIENKNASARRKSALCAAKAILALDICRQHKRDLLKVCIWKITEVDGKYKTRYRSRAALFLNVPNLEHEHVLRMRLLIDDLLHFPEKAESILGRAIGCTVTKQEHQALTLLDRKNPTIDGWDRYRVACIEVIDRATGDTFVGVYPNIPTNSTIAVST